MSKNLFIFIFFIAIVVGVIAVGANSEKGEFTVKGVLEMFGLYRADEPTETFIDKNMKNRKQAKEDLENTKRQQESLMENRKISLDQARDNQRTQQERMEDMKARQDAQREMMMDRMRDQRR